MMVGSAGQWFQVLKFSPLTSISSLRLCPRVTIDESAHRDDATVAYRRQSVHPYMVALDLHTSFCHSSARLEDLDISRCPRWCLRTPMERVYSEDHSRIRGYLEHNHDISSWILHLQEDRRWCRCCHAGTDGCT